MHIKNFDPFDFSKREIDGVPVYYKNLPWAPCVNIYIVFNTGAFNDPVGKEGLSHFLEHMIFDGSPRLKSDKAIREWSKKYALNSWNAFTNHYQTVYHLRCLPENYAKVLVEMKGMIFDPYLRKKDVEHERGVITQEIWRNYQNEKYLAFIRETADNVYHGHNYSRVTSAGGWPDTVAKISQKDIEKWHADNYAVGNFSIVLTGVVEEKSIVFLKKFIQDLPKKTFDKYVKGVVKKPKKLKIIKTGEEIGDPKEQVEITISRALSYVPEESVQTVNLFRSIISDILNERLRFEMGLCYSVMTGAWLYTDFSEVFMNIKTDEKNIDIVQKEFWKIIKEIVSGKHKRKFDTLKKVGIEQMVSRELMSDDIAYSVIVNDLSRYGNKVVTLKEALKRMKAVTYKDVADFTKGVFNPEWTVTEIILPSKK